MCSSDLVDVVALVPGRRDHDHAPVGGVLQGRLDLRAILPLPGPLLIGVPRGVVAVAEPRIDREAHDEDVQAGVGAVPDRPADRVGGEVAGGVAGLQADEVRAGRRPADDFIRKTWDIYDKSIKYPVMSLNLLN